MIRVAALTEGSHIPSSRFRIRQHIEPLSHLGVIARDFAQPFSNDRWQSILPFGLRIRHAPPLWPIMVGVEALQIASLLCKTAASWRYDVTWLSRALYPGYATFENLLKKPLVLDVDDAIWLNLPNQAKLAAERADRIVVGNCYLAEWYSRYNKNIIVAATAIDTERFFPVQRDETRPFTVGWTGTSGNFRYLYAINDALKCFFVHAPEARMLVVADTMPLDLDVPHDRFDFVTWTEDNEANMVQQMDVGLMPLADDAWTRGKCSFKMLQYMACGKPVVVSPVGMNAEVLAKGNIGFGPVHSRDWLDALTYLYENRNDAVSIGNNGRNVVEREFSRKVISGVLAEVFIGIV